MPEMTRPDLILTCEHGGNRIPAAYQAAFRNAEQALQSHRGYDPGALVLARRLSRRLQAPLFYETRSRLLIELNRSLHHPRLFSEFSRSLPASRLTQLIEGIYQPYRQQVIQALGDRTSRQPVVHLSVHSFTSMMKGRTRRTDLGLLFDPARKFELEFCTRWRALLRQALPGRNVHFNLPYRGTSDGFTTLLRTCFADECYAGIELEVNQKFPLGNTAEWQALQTVLATTLKSVLSHSGSS